METMSCPWSQFQPGHLDFCEAKLCAWIVKPAETWSNMAFVVIGLYIIYLARKENRPHLLPIGIVAQFLGVFSGLYHATGTFIGEWLDISSMILFTGTGIVYNLRRLFLIPKRSMVLIFATLMLTSMVLIYYFEKLGVVLFGMQFIGCALMELYLFSKAPVKANYFYFKAMVVTFLVAWGVWWLDIMKIWCNPDNHIFTGHAFWHVATSFTFLFVYHFFTQFKELEPGACRST